MRTFCRDLARSIPNIIRINRGKLSLTEVAEKALENDADKVVIVDRWKGGPGKVRLFKVNSEGLKAVPPLIYVKGVRFQRTFEKVKVRSVRSLALIFSEEKISHISKIGKALSDFFEIPILSMEEAVKSFQAAMVVSLDSMERIRVSFLLLPEKVEMGPRITISHVIWEINR
jgi:rRNA maturation protein Rpf1